VRRGCVGLRVSRVSDLDKPIAHALAVVERGERPLPEPCGKSDGCKLAGGCPECLVVVKEVP